MTINDAFSHYRAYLETLTADQVEALGNYVAEDVRFSDPFHDVVGVKEMSAIFTRVFCNVDQAAFKVLEHATDNSEIYFFRWDLTGKLNGKDWRVEGLTQLTFSSDGKVVCHREFLDAASQFYERFPIIGPLLRYCRRRIAGPLTIHSPASETK